MSKIELSLKEPRRLASIAKVLSSSARLEILTLLEKSSYMNVNEIAECIGIPISTAALHVKILEESGLIITRVEPATRGSQKLCYKIIGEVFINMNLRGDDDSLKSYYIDMPIGAYTDCYISEPCGIATETGNIGTTDKPYVFYYPERVNAQLIWFEKGYLEYRFPLDGVAGNHIEAISVEFECCSEAVNYNLDWPSDITVWFNQKEIATWTSPGDFGGRKGKLNPAWWGYWMTQYGILKSFKIDNTGTYLDENYISNLTLNEIHIDELPYLTVRIGIKEDSENQRGINLFGEKFGDYPQNILMRVDYRG